MNFFFFFCRSRRNHGILHGQQPELGVRAVRAVGRSAGARLHRAVLPQSGADGHVLPVQAAAEGLRRRTGAPRHRRRAGQMFPDAQGPNKLRPSPDDRRDRGGGWGDGGLEREGVKSVDVYGSRETFWYKKKKPQRIRSLRAHRTQYNNIF